MAGFDRDKALDVALAQIDKQFGKGSVMRLGDETRAPIQVIPTGSIALDVALGVGGLPRGRVVEIFGPESSGKTTVALHAVANAQATGGIAAYIDAEHALDPDSAQVLGVDTDALLVSQPDTGEQALEIADMLIRSGALDVIVVDSVAALVPRAEIEGEMGDSHVGLQARLMSQALRKLTGALSNSGTTMIFINQLREKVGVMFGCLSYSTRVTLADGTQEKIGKIVNQRMPVDVLSYDPEIGKVVPKRVVNWFDNGPAKELLQITVARPGGNGRSQLGLTANHLVRTPGGWREAGELLPGDRVMLAQPHRLSDRQWQVILGGLMGDGALSPSRIPGSLGTRFRMGHGAKQVEYLDWKASLFGNIGQSRSTNAKDAVFVDLSPLPELAELRRAVYLDRKKHLSWDYLKALTPLALAIWYMDDGGFTVRAKDGAGRSEICVEAISPGSRQRLVEHLADTFDLHPRLWHRGSRRIAVLTFAKDETAKLHALIAPYVHPSMDYKLIPRHRGQFAVRPEFVEPTILPVPAPVLSVAVKPRTRSMHRFDIEVEGSHNYLADGVVVHNSPETTTGGRALKFYSSVRLDIRRIETLKDGQEAIGSRTRVKVVKNKCLAEGTLVFDPISGATHRIEEIVDGRLDVSVVAAAKDGLLHTRPVVSWFDQGEQEVLGLAIAGGSSLWATPDHKVLTDRGWRLAGEIKPGDRVARPRRFLGFGHAEPVTPDHARLLGYLIGDGYVGGKTPIQFINIESSLQEDIARIAATLGCEARPQGQLSSALSHRPGEKNGVLALCRDAGIHGKLAWEKTIPPYFFSPDTSADVVANLIFGLLETDGWMSAEQTGAIRVGFATTSEQLAHQIHWLLLRFGIVSTVRDQDLTQQRPSLIEGRPVQGKRPIYEVRVAGVDNVEIFADVIPMWGPRGRKLTEALDAMQGRRRGSQAIYLAKEVGKSVLRHLERRGVTPTFAAQLVGKTAGDPQGGMRQVLGLHRIRRDRLQRLADALDDPFLYGVLADELWYATVREILPVSRRRAFDIEVDELHTFIANDVIVHNCASPFKQAEFDIVYGQGISREGSLLDVGVEQSIIRKSGAWYTYEGDQLGQGKENARGFLRDNPDLADEIEKKIKEKLGVGPQIDEESPVPVAPVDF
jgi:recombination protein RecA